VPFFNSIAYSLMIISGSAIFLFSIKGSGFFKVFLAAVYGYLISVAAYYLALEFFDIERTGSAALMGLVGGAHVLRVQLVFPLLSFTFILLPIALIVSSLLARRFSQSP
jgi:hypothetical protein